MQGGQCATESEFEDCAATRLRTVSEIPSAVRRAIKIAVAGFHEVAAGILTIGTAALQAEVVERGESAAGSHHENGSAAAGPNAGAPFGGGPIEVAVASEQQRTVRAHAIGRIEAVQSGQSSGRRDFEDRAVKGIVDSAILRSAVEIPIIAEHQRRDGILAIGAIALRTEVIDGSHGSAGCDLDDVATGIGAAVVGGSVEIAIGSLSQSGIRVGTIRAGEAVQRGKGLCGQGDRSGGAQHRYGDKVLPAMQFNHANPPAQQF